MRHTPHLDWHGNHKSRAQIHLDDNEPTGARLAILAVKDEMGPENLSLILLSTSVYRGNRGSNYNQEDYGSGEGDTGPALRLLRGHPNENHAPTKAGCAWWEFYRNLFPLPKDLWGICRRLCEGDESAVVPLLDLIQEERGTERMPEELVSAVLKCLNWE